MRVDASHPDLRNAIMLAIFADFAHARAMKAEGEDDSRFDALEHEFRAARTELVAWFRRRIGDASEAEDLCQECFLRVQLREAPGGIDDVHAYLYRTARSVLADRMRRRSTRHAEAHAAIDEAEGAGVETDPLISLMARERLRRVSAVLAGMPERTRAVFVLSRLEGQRYSEIAARIGISVSAVQKHMIKAINTLLSEGGEE